MILVDRGIVLNRLAWSIVLASILLMQIFSFSSPAFAAAVSVRLRSDGPSGENDLGQIIFNHVAYNLPTTLQNINPTGYVITALPPDGFKFKRWDSIGTAFFNDPNSPTTIATVFADKNPTIIEMELVKGTTGPTFGISVFPSSISFEAGQSGTTTVSVNDLGGNPHIISLSCNIPSSELHCSFNPNNVRAGSGTSVLTVSSDSTSTPSNYNIEVIGTDCEASCVETHSTQIQLTIQSPPQVNPTLSSTSFSPSSVYPGNSFTAYYTINNPNSNSITVGLGMSIRPSGSYSEISDPSNDKTITASPGTNTYSRSFVVSSSASTGPYDVIMAIWDGSPGSSNRITDSGWRSGLTVQSVVVTPTPFDFTISSSPSSITMKGEETSTSTITVALVSGESKDISLSCSGIPSSQGSCNPSKRILNVPGTTTLTIFHGAVTSTKTYTLTVTGTYIPADGSAVTDVRQISLTVQPSIIIEDHRGVLQVDKQIIELEKFKNTILTVYGEIENYRKGTSLKLAIIKPDQTVEEMNIVVKENGEFASPILFDKNSETGSYRIKAIYDNSEIGSVEFVVKLSVIVPPPPLPIPTSITVSVNPSSITENVQSSIIVSGKLTNLDTGQGVSGKPVQVSLYGNTETVTSDSNGFYQYTFQVNMSAGSRNIEARFSADKLYKESVNTIVLSVQSATTAPATEPNVKLSFIDVEREFGSTLVVGKTFSVVVRISTDEPIHDVEISLLPNDDSLVPITKSTHRFSGKAIEPTFLGVGKAELRVGFKALSAGQHKITATAKYSDQGNQRNPIEADYFVSVKQEYLHPHFDECITPSDQDGINFYICPDALEKAKTFEGANLVAGEIFAKKLLKKYGGYLSSDIAEEISTDPKSAGKKLLAIFEDADELTLVLRASDVGDIANLGLLMGKVGYDYGTDAFFINQIANGATYVKGWSPHPDGGIYFRTSMLGEFMSISFWVDIIDKAMSREEKFYTPELKRTVISDD